MEVNLAQPSHQFRSIVTYSKARHRLGERDGVTSQYKTKRVRKGQESVEELEEGWWDLQLVLHYERNSKYSQLFVLFVTVHNDILLQYPYSSYSLRAA
eukprot:4961107-Amphidinium_carterae.1